MPSYAKCRVAELRQISEMCGINCDGLRKPELIDALCSYDTDNYRDGDDDDDNDGRLDIDVESQGSYNEGSDLESDSDGNVYLRRDDGCDLGDTGHISRPPSVVSSTRCRSEREMELQLEIKKIEAQRTLERERWERERVPGMASTRSSQCSPKWK